MSKADEKRAGELGPPMTQWSLPGRALATMVVLMLAIGMGGALGQIIVHDIIPTFGTAEKHPMLEMESMPAAPAERGDLFAEEHPVVEKRQSAFYESEEFIFALKFTHIHLFGMSGIFIVMGALVLFLDLEPAKRTWLITLPFVGIVFDLLSVWLKRFVHPAFFWLHIPGGMLFGLVFAIDSIFILKQLWRPAAKGAGSPSANTGN